MFSSTVCPRSDTTQQTRSIKVAIAQAQAALSQLALDENIAFISAFAKALERCFATGNKLLVAGNGGSLCDAMHFAEELTGFFRKKRQPLPAIALSDPGHMSCVSNDLSFNAVFERQIQALCVENDCVVLLSTSGNSQNLIQALEAAREKRAFVVCLLGGDGGQLAGKGDLELIIKGFGFSDRIQEVHMSAIHMVIEQLETLLFSE